MLSRGVVPAGKFAPGANQFGPPRPSSSNKNVQTTGQYQVKYSQPLPGDNPINAPLNHHANSKQQPFANGNDQAAASQPQTAAQTASYSKTSQPKPPPPSQSKTNYPPSPQQQKTKNSKTSKPKQEPVQQQQKAYENEAEVTPRRPTEKPQFTTPADKFTSDEQQKHVDVSDDDQEEVELVKLDDDGFGNEDVQAQLKEQTSTPATNAHHQSLNLKKEDKNEVEDEFDDENDEFTIVKPFPQQDSCPAGCQASCAPSTRSVSGDMDSMTVKEFAARIKADALFDMFPDMEEQFQTVIDFASAGYTMFLPSNEAISRLPKSLIKR